MLFPISQILQWWAQGILVIFWLILNFLLKSLSIQWLLIFLLSFVHLCLMLQNTLLIFVLLFGIIGLFLSVLLGFAINHFFLCRPIIAFS